MMSLLLGAAAGYVLGARAGRERYEQIVRLGRRVAGSQTVQSVAGVLQAQVEDATHRVRDAMTSGLAAKAHSAPKAPHAHANGHQR